MVDIPNYYERMIALLASQFQGATANGGLTNFQNLLYAIAHQFQDIQTQENLLNSMRELNTAQGVQLEGNVIKNGQNVLVGLGTILGLDRIVGQPDDDSIIDGKQVTGYRQDLQFQIFVNNSQGTPEEVIYMLFYLTKATKVWYNECYPASYQMATNGLTFPPFPSDIVGAIQQVSPAGVDFIAVTAIYNTNPLVFSSDPIDEQFYVAPNPDDPSQSNLFQVNAGAGAENFFIQRGETVNPDFGGFFAEGNTNNSVNEVGAGSIAEAIMTNGNIAPIY